MDIYGEKVNRLIGELGRLPASVERPHSGWRSILSICRKNRWKACRQQSQMQRRISGTANPVIRLLIRSCVRCVHRRSGTIS